MHQDDVLLIDRSKLFREGMKRLLAEHSFRVCGEASSLDEAIQHIEDGRGPRLILLDYPGNGVSADETTKQMQRLHSQSQSKLVVLTTELNFDWLVTVLSAGAAGYLLKEMSPDAFIQSLRLILLGERVLPTDVALMLLSGHFRTEHQVKPPIPTHDLSQREVQILRCLLRGDSNKLIANQLSITEGTVKVHLKGVLKKINVRNRTQAAIWALNSGLINGPPPSLAPERAASD
jgi:two-component system nitrate/nitrite response regulator NarL